MLLEYNKLFVGDLHKVNIVRLGPIGHRTSLSFGIYPKCSGKPLNCFQREVINLFFFFKVTGCSGEIEFE